MDKQADLVCRMSWPALSCNGGLSFCAGPESAVLGMLFKAGGKHALVLVLRLVFSGPKDSSSLSGSLATTLLHAPSWLLLKALDHDVSITSKLAAPPGT